MSHRALFALATPLCLAACQSYEPQPVSPDGHRDLFMQRTLSAGLPHASTAEPAFDLKDGITSTEAEAVALVYNADVRIARARAGVTAVATKSARTWTDPVIGIDLERILESVANPWTVAASIALTIPLSGRLDAQQALADAEHAAELARVAEAEWRLRMDVRRAFVRLAAARARVESARTLSKDMERALKMIDAAERAGEMARVEARLFRIDSATRNADLAALVANAEEAEIETRQLMGLSPAAPLTLVTGSIDVSTATMDLEQRGKLAVHGPLVRPAIDGYTTAERLLELRVREQSGDLGVAPGVARDEGNDKATLGLSVPLPIFSGNRPAIEQATARRDQARTELEAAIEHVLSELALADSRFHAALKRLDATQETLVPLIADQERDTETLARLGEVNTIVLLESLSRGQQAMLRLIDARFEAALAAIRLEELTGPLPMPETTP